MNDNYYSYRGYGLNIRSRIECPELNAGNGASPDIKIQFGEVPDSLSQVDGSGVLYQAAPDQFLLDVKNIAKYLVQDGSSITIKQYPRARSEDVRLFLLGSAFGALLHQRGFLVIHGSAIAVNDECYIFTGRSGAGKSTIAAALHQSGYKPIADDVCAIVFSENQAIVYSELKVIRLWEDSLIQLGMNPDVLQHSRQNLDKYNFTVGQNDSTVVPLKGLYFLSANGAPEVSLELMEGKEKIKTLLTNTYRRRYLDGLGLKEKHFIQCSELAKKISIKKINRPKNCFMLCELVELLESDFLK